MSNTVIQIKRSTNTAIPSTLEAGELAFTSNGNSLWIGSPVGNTSNVIHVGSQISYFANATQIGATSGGSNTELASTYAIKTFVDSKFAAYSTTLSGLDDVSITSVANNDFLVYDAAAGKWENHTVNGTANQITAAFVDNNLTISLANDVTIANSLTVTSSLTVNGAANIVGESHFANLVHIDRTGTDTSHFVTNPTLTATANTNNWTQVSIQNLNAGANASADFIAYPDNTAEDDNTGFIDIGITSSVYNQAAYSVTAPNDGYIFASARANSGLTGSLILATDSTGTNNDIRFFTGGFTFNYNEPHMVFVGSGANKGHLGISNTAPTSMLSVGGSGWFNGDVDVSNTVNVGANVTITTAEAIVKNGSSNTVVGGGTLTVNSNGATTTISGGDITGVGTLTIGSILVGNSTVNVAITATSISSNGTLSIGNTVITGTANVTGDVNIGGSLAAGNTTITGDLVVTGTVTTVDTVNLVVEDSLIRLARNQANTDTFTDAVDIGFYGLYGNTSNTLVAGFARESASNNFVLFVDKDPTSIDNDGITTSDSLGTLYAYLASGALTTNSTAVALTANTTVSVSITANSLSLSSALAVSSGGTGATTFASNSLLLGNDTGALSTVTNGANGTVLQITNNVPVFAGLDGGTF